MIAPAPRFEHLAQVDSTNEHARRLATQGETGPLWVSADRQTSGRGRRGRGWVSDTGNLYASLLITLPVATATAAQMAFVTALGLHDTAAHFLTDSTDLKLKWPNDVLLGGKKFAGILIETLPPPRPHATTLAIGCGVNIAHGPNETAYPATWLNAHAEAHVDPQGFLRYLAENVNARLNIWNNGGNFRQTSADWRKRACFVGEQVAIATATATICGCFHGLGDDGALILRHDNGSLQAFHAGDVSLRPVKP